MSADDYRRLSWLWFAFPGRAKVASRYEQFLNGLLQSDFPALASVYRVRVTPTDLPPASGIEI